MGKLQLKWRIFVFLLGFCALLITILWFFQTVLLTETYKLVRRIEIGQAMAQVEKNINNPNLQTFLDDLRTDKEILVTPATEVHVVRPESGAPPRRPVETVTETKRFALSDGRVVSLTFFAIITPVGATVSALRFQLYIIVGIMLLCSVVLAVVIARRVSKPMEELTEGAKALASGRYETHFSGRGFLEIKELSDTLNAAAVELSKADGLRRELMANISHDLRTPLALIYSYAEMMHDFPAEVTPDQTQVIMNETKRLTSLVNDVLDVSQMETGTVELRPTTYNLTESLKDTVARVSELVSKEGYGIAFERSGEIYVRADEIKITRAFYNLLINAIHYSPADRAITVRQTFAKGKVRIEVADQGGGIEPEHLPSIWDRYYKVDKKHKRAIAGTGLGLSIVKKIIEMHEGACGVTSTLGKGSSFWFELPAESGD